MKKVVPLLSPPVYGGSAAEGGEGGEYRACPLRLPRLKAGVGTSPEIGGGKVGCNA
jgi:hypothetical protein